MDLPLFKKNKNIQSSNQGVILPNIPQTTENIPQLQGQTVNKPVGQFQPTQNTQNLELEKKGLLSKIIPEPVRHAFTQDSEEKVTIKEYEKPKVIKPILSIKEGMHLLDVIAPQKFETDFDHVKLNEKYYRTLYTNIRRRFVNPGWLEPLINFNHSLNTSFYIYPVEGKTVLDDLRRKITEMEAELSTDIDRGKIVNPTTKAKLEDALALQEQLVKGIEGFFEMGLYITIPAHSPEELNHITKQVQSTLQSLLVDAESITLDQERGFITTVPWGQDKLYVNRNMDTTSLATTFPFTTAELSNDKGVLYGINPQNDSFIIFDRYSMENSNMSVFGTSGGGKSYFVKLESVRSLMLGTEVIIIDPEAEYKDLSDSVGGEYISFSFSSESKINPFDLSQVYVEGENQLGLKILSLHSLFKVIMGQLSPTQEALLDRALIATYKSKGITQDPETQKKEPPLMEDLYKTLIGMETAEAQDLAARIEKFVKGSFVGIFDKHTNIDLSNPFTVFSVKDMQEALRPIAMFVILDFIWTRVQRDLKKRMLIVDEAWHMMRYEDSAQFLWSVVKRARKYWLGLTTITQDVEDFLSQDIGKAIVTNSSLKLLLKQSPAAIDRIAEIFYLSQGEKQLLLAANVGEGIFFAGPHHAPIRIVASDVEHELITTNPSEMSKRNEKPSYIGDNNKTNQPQQNEELIKPAFMEIESDQSPTPNSQTTQSNDNGEETGVRGQETVAVSQTNTNEPPEKHQGKESPIQDTINKESIVQATAFNQPPKQGTNEVILPGQANNPNKTPEQKETDLQNQINALLNTDQNGNQ